MFKWLRFSSEKKPAPEKDAVSSLLHAPGFDSLTRAVREAAIFAQTFRQTQPAVTAGMAMDGLTGTVTTPDMVGIPERQLRWFGGHAFMGYQACAMLMQHWLIDRACTLPARDAVRGGYKTTVNDGTDVPPQVLDALANFDKARDIDRQMVEFVRMGRGFGIRVALFLVDNTDPDYYEKPFNPDGVTAGSYRGISQIDPMWMVPELSGAAASDPAAPDFYTPTWWRIGGKRYHRSHLVIMKTAEPPDILKPTYQFGGIPVPQMIAERVYAAERVADEMPALALSKRTTVMKTDTAAALADQQTFEEALAFQAAVRDNYGVKVVDSAEDVQQFETSLANLDDVVMTAYQIAAAASGVPATKLLGTTPKGFNASGDYEEAAYHEELESIQTSDLKPFLARHHLLAIRSYICPKFKCKPFAVESVFNPLDAMTAKEQAEVNAIKATTAATYVNIGALDGDDVRAGLIADPDSGYSGLSNAMSDEEAEYPDLPGAPDAAPAVEEKTVAEVSMNGAQVSSMIEVLNSVAAGTLPRDSGIEILVTAFPVDRPGAEKLMGSIGNGFVPAVLPPSNGGFHG